LHKKKIQFLDEGISMGSRASVARFRASRWLAALAVLIFAGLLWAASTEQARAFPEGTRGWCTSLPPGHPGPACFATPMEACKQQHSAYNPNKIFLGYVDYFDQWHSKLCKWSAGGIDPTTVSFNCESSVQWTRHPSEVCVNANENLQTRVADDNATPNPATCDPVSLMSGAKIFTVEDFKTNDGSLELVRIFNSRAFGRSRIFYRWPAGLSQNWRYSFQHELQIDRLFGTNNYVQLLTADGSSFPFRRNDAGQMPPSTVSGSTPQTDYTLEFVGTWPATLSEILTTPTQWRVRDSQDREWLFQTLLDTNLKKYNFARPISVTFRGGLRWTFQYGTYGELTSITDSFDKTISFAWIIYDPSELGSTSPARPLAISTATLPDGSRLEYVYEALNPALISLPQPDRLVEVRRIDAADSVIDSTKYLYENPDFPRNVTGILDANGVRRWTVTYDSRGRATSSSGPDGVNGHTISYARSGTGNLIVVSRAVTNALGKTATYEFRYGGSSDLNNLRLTAVNGVASANCPASTRIYTYTGPLGFMETETDEEGRVARYVRDARGLPTSITRGHGTPAATTTNYTWHPTLRVPTQIVEPGLTTDLTWNSSGQMTQLSQTDTTTHSAPYATNGQSRIWTFTYAPVGGLLASVDGPLSGAADTVTYTYNSDGYLESVTNEVGHLTQFSGWNGRGQPTAMTDPNAVITEFSYDALGRLTGMTVDPGGIAAITSFNYDVVGDVTKITRPNGAFLQYTRDDARRVTKVEDNTGASVSYFRDAMGNVTERRIQDSANDVLLAQTAIFDELGRLLRFVGAASQTWTHAYDKTSNLISVTDPRSNVYQWAFDPLNRLVRETDEVSARVDVARNGKDEVIQYTDPRSLSTTYVRNGFGDVIQRESPDSGTTVYEYNALGKPTKITDGRGIVTNLTYDNAGRLLTREYPAATGENITNTWDAIAGGNKGRGRLTRIEDQSGSVEWIYDTLGRAVQEKKVNGTTTYTLDYAYDADGNVTQITYPSGRIVNYARDALGRISGVTTKTNGASPVVTLASDVDYRPFGPLTGLTYGNGLALVKTFDLDYRPDGILVHEAATSITILDRLKAYSDGVNLTGINDNLDQSRTESFAYTPANRLQSADGLWGTLNYTYDLVGNRASEALTQGSTTTTATYAHPSGSNRLATVTEGVNVRAFTHDNAGNVTADDRAGTVYNYAYNNRGRLSGLSIGATPTASYIFDGLERLALRATQNMTPAGTTHYLYDLEGHLLVEANETGQTMREYLWLDDLPLAVIADVDTTPQLLFVHADHLDRPIKMTNASKAVVWDAVYRPFGEVHSITGSATNNLRFPGQYFLLESGLHYNWHRHYDPTLGRYLQPDPMSMLDVTAIGVTQARPATTSLFANFIDKSPALGGTRQFGLPDFTDGPSFYAYSKSAPTMNFDPEGRQSLPIPRPGLTPIPPIFVPGTPENRRWAAQAISGARGLVDQLAKLCRRDECDDQYEADNAICRSLHRQAARARCFESATARYGACRAGNSLPPLITW
jgi:RHS repeat-associated protein